MAKPYPGQILLQTPKGIILISLLPVISNASPSPFRNLSGLKAMGSSHTFGSHPISATMKFTVPFLGIRYPPNTVSSVTACGSTKCPGGCLRRPSRIIAFKYGIFCRSSSFTSPSPYPTTSFISENSFS
ncbi:hypothetical protein POPTR_013G076501v4 [Populus trichocarpa]|uniref:Uncharacterized protein n=1 Tax=Populus trichocarpa TaxID=3694 RepID=A0ACC0S1I7_POPTR|nr:hypothetical protein POPTR_013G076501v4 [Populus trichocarpa]